MPFTKFLRYFSVAAFMLAFLTFIGVLIAILFAGAFEGYLGEAFVWALLALPVALLAAITYLLCRLAEGREMNEEALRQSILTASDRAAAQAAPAPAENQEAT